MSENQPYNLDRLVRLIFSAIGIVISIYIIAQLKSVLIPFGIAFILAYLLNPFVDRLSEKTGKHKLSVAIVLLTFFGLFFSIGYFIIPMIIHEFADMGRLLTKIIMDTSFSQNLAEKIPAQIWEPIIAKLNQDDFLQLMQQGQFWEYVKIALGKILPSAFNVVSGTVSVLIALLSFVIIILYLVFMLLDFKSLKAEITSLLPTKYKDFILDFGNEFALAMNNYFRGQTLVAFSVGILFAIGFTIIGLPMGIALGLFIGLLNMIPYLQLAGLLPAAFLAVVSALDNGTGVASMLTYTAIVFAVVQIIQDSIIVPKIMGKITGLSPVMVLLSISIWGKLLGFLGLLLAIPFTCLVLAYYRQLQKKSTLTLE